MRPMHKVLVVIAVILVVLMAIGIYVLQYKNLEVDVDSSESGVNRLGPQDMELRIVLRFKNTGDTDLAVPPTDFEVWVDGLYVGPGKSDGVDVPGGGTVWSTAIVEVSNRATPLAFAALVDPGSDQVRLKGEAHVEVGPFTLDFPFDETFKVDV